MELICVRHGRTAWNALRKFQGQTDVPLDDEGLAQAQALAAHLRDEHFDVALTSDLIDLASDQGGRFFLPYQLHYTAAQLKRAYPEIGAFFAAKSKWDPDGLFGNSWYARYAPAVTSG